MLDFVKIDRDGPEMIISPADYWCLSNRALCSFLFSFCVFVQVGVVSQSCQIWLSKSHFGTVSFENIVPDKVMIHRILGNGLGIAGVFCEYDDRIEFGDDIDHLSAPSPGR